MHRLVRPARARVGRFLSALALVAAIGGNAAACQSEHPPAEAARTAADSGGISDRSQPVRGEPVAQLLFAGDVMLGRGVAQGAAANPDGLFAGIRSEVRSASFAVANLESPLTSRAHDPSFGPNALEAQPGSARLLAAAGFNAMAIANNHAGDAGPATVTNTIEALATAGLPAIGGGIDSEAAFEPTIVRAGELRVALLAFDATGQGPRAKTDAPGVAWWDEARVKQAVDRARAGADLVVVGLHGGAEYVPVTDPYLMRLGQLLASWGVDIVWGTGPHVTQPVHVIDPDGDGRPTIVATSLGNLIFDQHIPGTREGAMLAVLVGSDGSRAFRVGLTDHTEGPVQFGGWEPPGENAVAVEGSWWTLASSPTVHPVERPTALETFPGDAVNAAIGDPDGDERPDLVVAFRRPFTTTEVNALVPRGQLVDEQGRSAHLGLYRPGDLRPRWVAGTLLRPVAEVAPCDGSLAVAYSTLEDEAIVGTGAWRWGGFGFVPLPDLAGPGVPACADVDGDGRLDPLVLERSAR